VKQKWAAAPVGAAQQHSGLHHHPTVWSQHTMPSRTISMRRLRLQPSARNTCSRRHRCPGQHL